MSRTGSGKQFHGNHTVYRAEQLHNSRHSRSRERIVHLQKCTLAFCAIIILTGAVLLGSCVCAFAGSTQSKQNLYTYYTSIELEQGDTLWDIAQEYTFGTGIDTQDYIEEVCMLNHLSDAESIHEGNCIVIPYYTYEQK